MFGGTAPPGLLDGQTKAFIFDPDHMVINVQQKLYPFDSMVQIIQNSITLTSLLQTEMTKTVILILILQNQTRDYVVNYINNNIFRQSSIHSFYLFFTEGHQHKAALQTHFSPLLIDCYSITNRLFNEIQDALSMACDLNVKFFCRRANEEEANGNNSLVSMYKQQHQDHLRLQIVYNTKLIAEIERRIYVQ